MPFKLIDLRDGIADYDSRHRRWPRGGSVSKPFSQTCLVPLDVLMNKERRERYVREWQEDQEARELSFKTVRFFWDNVTETLPALSVLGGGSVIAAGGEEHNIVFYHVIK